MSSKDLYGETVRALLSVIEVKDDTIRTNAQRIARSGAQFARVLKMARGEVDRIYLAGLLHDIGMLHVPAEIIQKAGSLTDGEWAMVKMHPLIAEKIIGNLSFLKGILPIVRHHHEAVDGSGYPDSLSGEKIPFEARVLCLVDSYDAMISGRPYHPAWSMEKAFEEIDAKAGKQFDKMLVDKFKAFLQLEETKIQPAEVSAGSSLKKDSVREVINKIVEKFKMGDIELPLLPKVIVQVRKAMDNPMSTTDDVAKIIEKDAVISLRLVTVSNSAVYRGADRIQTVRQAVPRLGMKQTQSIVNTIANKNMYKANNENFMVLMEKLWLHSLASAYAAKSIALKCRLGDEESYFMMGLSHDIGMALLLRAMDEVISESDGMNMDEVYQGIREIHCEFGSALLQRWKFNPQFVRVAKMHDDSKFSAKAPDEVLVVNLASLLTRSIGYSMQEQEDINLLETDSAKILNISEEALGQVVSEVKQTMQESAHIF